jgi:arginase
LTGEAEIDQTPVILHVETNLGLRPGGVERLGSTLLELGLAERIGAQVLDTLRAPPFENERDPVFGVPNIEAIAEVARQQADRVGQILDDGAFPVVLGGDDSVLLGNLQALRRRGSSGLMFLDGHTDFWDLSKTSTGELSDSDLWLATGHGPDVLANPEGLAPLVDPRACVIYGHRDRREQLETGSEDVYRQPMLVRSLGEVRSAGIEDASHHAIAFLAASGVDQVWLHLDADCLDDALMPAVDWRAAGGMTPIEVVDLIRPLLEAELLTGMDVTIYNPALDTSDMAAGRVLLELLEAVLS